MLSLIYVCMTPKARSLRSIQLSDFIHNQAWVSEWACKWAGLFRIVCIVIHKCSVKFVGLCLVRIHTTLSAPTDASDSNSFIRIRMNVEARFGRGKVGGSNLGYVIVNNIVIRIGLNESQDRNCSSKQIQLPKELLQWRKRTSCVLKAIALIRFGIVLRVTDYT